MPLELRTPHNERLSLELPVEVAQLSTPFNGSICGEDGRLFSIDRNIVQLVDNKRSFDTLAQLANHIPVTAQVYEDLWRRRSIGVLSGKDFSLEEEKTIAGLDRAKGWGKYIRCRMFHRILCKKPTRL